MARDAVSVVGKRPGQVTGASNNISDVSARPSKRSGRDFFRGPQFLLGNEVPARLYAEPARETRFYGEFLMNAQVRMCCRYPHAVPILELKRDAEMYEETEGDHFAPGSII